jgi:hypothetical protein
MTPADTGVFYLQIIIVMAPDQKRIGKAHHAFPCLPLFQFD